jgi:hypothetical protein
MESVGAQVRHCKKSSPTGFVYAEAGSFWHKREHIRCHIGAYTTFTVTVLRVQRRGRCGFLVFPEGNVISGSGMKCSSGEIKKLVDDRISPAAQP